MEKLEILERRLKREKAARKQAEQYLEAKSRELFYKGKELEHAMEAERQSRRESEILRDALTQFTAKFDFHDIAEELERFLSHFIARVKGAIVHLDCYTQKLYPFKNDADADKTLQPTEQTRKFVDEINQSKEPTVLEGKEGSSKIGWNTSDFDGTWIICPMDIGGSSGSGCLVIFSRSSNKLEDSTLKLIQALADEATIAFENARLFQEVQRLSITDPLTGLSNRRHFDKAATWEFERSIRYQFPLTAIMIDIDHFKKVNDLYGHEAGDRVLKEVAQVLRNISRSTDVLARLGGEEFCILLPETETQTGGFEFSERMRLAISQLFFTAENKQFSITSSFGLASRLESGDSVSDLLTRCDQALYQAKAEGRNRSIIWTRT